MRVGLQGRDSVIARLLTGLRNGAGAVPPGRVAAAGEAVDCAPALAPPGRAHPRQSLRDAGRILYVSSVDVSLDTGPAVNELEFIVALHDALRERAHFLVPRPARPVADLPGAACTLVRPHRNHHPVRFAAHALAQLRAADRLLAGRRFDLLVFRLDVVPIVPLVITRKHPVPYAVKTIGATTVHVLRRLPWVGSGLAAVNRRLFRDLVARALVADAASRLHVASLQSALGLGPDHVVWIDNAVNTRRFFPMPVADARRALGLERFDRVAGYVGNLPDERGGTQLVEALPRLLPRHPGLGLVVLGGGPGRERLAGRARELGMLPRCVFTGHVPYERVPVYTNALDVGVSLLLPESHAASEQKVRQYLACGKPVIATTPGGNDFVAHERLGSLVRHDDADAIVAELDRWLSLPGNERATFAARASRYAAERLSVAQAVARRLALWDERLERGAAEEAARA
jgi:glycosyltransferase involved in cell wall biosynthesis